MKESSKKVLQLCRQASYLLNSARKEISNELNKANELSEKDIQTYGIIGDCFDDINFNVRAIEDKINYSLEDK